MESSPFIYAMVLECWTEKYRYVVNIDAKGQQIEGCSLVEGGSSLFHVSTVAVEIVFV